jgi:glucuronosyltransferase
MTATPSPTSYVPNTFLRYTDKMTFFERLHNTVMWKLDELHLYTVHYPRQRKLYEKYFPNAESFEKQRKNIALLLNNNFFSSHTVRPGMTNVIDIGGIHVEPAKPLPENIQEFLDSATDGVILFSMGSIIQAVKWPEEKREAFVKAFGKLKQKVLWKYENETLPNKPSNVMISPWIPQRDILAHPNVKLFITHGGLLGTTEALVEGVPVLGIPIFGDQKMNMNVASSKGYAMTLDYSEISENSVTQALDKVLSRQEISLKAKEASRMYTDRPMTPQKSTVYWVEYVVKFKGASHLRPAGLDLNYFELHSVDVYVFIMTIAIGTLISLKKFVLFIVRKCKTSNGSEEKFKAN